MNNNHTVCFVAGRSGGHILPALTLAKKYKQDNQHNRVLFFSTNTHLDAHIVGSNSIIDYYVPLTLENVPYRKLSHYPRFVWHALRSLLTSIRQLHKYKPTKIVSTGGYISIPVCIAAALLRIPVELHELNAVPGKATKLLASIAHPIIVCFADAQRYFPIKKCRVAPYPVRFITQEAPLCKKEIVTALGLNPQRTTLFILGGSQGSLFINNMVKQWVEQSPEQHNTLQIIHQTGAHDTTDWHAFYAHHGIPAIVFAYHNAIEQYYTAADLIICRSGAGTLWEITYFGKKAITIPLETATTDHQIDNAQAIVAQYPHLFTMITQKEIADNPLIMHSLITKQIDQSSAKQ